MGRVAGKLSAGLVSFVFSSWEVNGNGSYWLWVFGRERERGISREKISFFPCLCVSRGGRRCTVPFKTTLFPPLFFNGE